MSERRTIRVSSCRTGASDRGTAKTRKPMTGPGPYRERSAAAFITQYQGIKGEETERSGADEHGGQ